MVDDMPSTWVQGLTLMCKNYLAEELGMGLKFCPALHSFLSVASMTLGC